MNKSTILFTFVFSLFTFVFSFAQESKIVKTDTLKTANTNQPNSTQVEEGDVKITDGTNTLIRITDEGTFGAIEIKSGVPSTTTDKLYNENGVLSFGGSPINSSGDNDWTVSGNDMYSKPTGNIGVGTNSPTEKLEVVGKTKTSELQVTTGATDGYILTSDVDGNATWQAPSGSGLNLSIGDTYQGGIIFWLDGSGKHGLIAQTSDIGSTYFYNNGGLGIPYGTARGIYSGEVNTELLANYNSLTGAAHMCYNSTVNGYDDWYLPSLDESLIMMTNLYVKGLGSFLDNTYYWTSSRDDEAINGAYMINTLQLNNNDGHGIKPFGEYLSNLTSIGNVRAIRRF